MDIAITEKDAGSPFVQMDASGIRLVSRFGEGVFHCHTGKGFACWNNHYRFSEDTVLEARADMAVLELHIARKGIWKGSWEGISALDVHPWQFNLSYTPHVKTSAFFRKDRVYHSCDLHVDFDYLQSLAADFPALDIFLTAVTRQAACNLSSRNHSCTREMMAIVNALFQTNLSITLFAMQVRQLLIAALEKVSIDTGRPLPVITKRHVEGLQYARTLIEGWDDQLLSLKELATQCGLNEYALKSGFQKLFGISPYAYHVEQKMSQAKCLLLDTNMAISTIAYQLGYSQSSSFGHEFRKAVGMSPGEFRKSGRV